MEASGADSDVYRGSSTSSTSYQRRHGIQFSASNFFLSPLSTLLEYSGVLRTRPSYPDSDRLLSGGISTGLLDHIRSDHISAGSHGEVSIRIIGAGEQYPDGSRNVLSSSTAGLVTEVTPSNELFLQPMARSASIASALDNQGVSMNDLGAGEGLSQSVHGNTDVEATEDIGVSSQGSSYQRYDIQQAARWIEQVLPFSLLLLVVFIRQHLQGFFVTLWIGVVMLKSNDILRKQTALKGERKLIVLTGIALLFALHVVGVYWWYRHDDLIYPLFMIPPKAIPPFWHAIFIILVNDTLVRQAAMVVKCLLLIYFKNNKGRNFRKQGQVLTLMEYMLLLYRALLPAPVWYRFFLNKENGSLFSSLMTGLYLTFKLTSVIEKVHSFFAALKALSHKEILYGAYATSEQVNAAGDLCAICQEKMHAPILLRCKHIFCEDCVSEWFERERTCPLCRALVKPSDLKSFGDGSTSLFFQVF